ncbi:MAG: hypothetical protein KF767_02380 [Bdellovibrionaceae bacterium]|nr:hypothetical protein [Pseudobdellovibrionaceae bacterium]
MAGPIENDPFEEFEFKPITEGLGFHSQSKNAAKTEQKADAKTDSKVTAKPDLKFEARRSASEQSARAEKNLVDDLLDLNSLETGKLDQPLLRTPLLKRSGPAATTEIPTAPTPKVDEVLKGLQKQNWDFKDEKATAARQALKAPPEYVYRPSGHDLSALVLDTMLVVAAFLGCLIVLLMVTQIDLVAAITTASTEVLAMTLGALMGTICWVYLCVNRVFLGATPGEWVFDQRLGPAEAQGTASFAWKSILRSTILLATGIVVLPVLSLLSRRDLLGRWMGLELHQKNLK